ncbi:MAG TPA: sugar phosphate isomerase/epimerase family protein [Planctomycetia bacterium]|nr:sugar phosphate isomerase/epimerase family protein [Planctomycetia bacterium]
MAISPFEIGVCSWSLQVGSIPELAEFCKELGIEVVQIACGDPHHASWAEGEAMPAAAKNAGLRYSGTMIGFPGEDYTTPEHIKRTGGFGDPATRAERLERFRWAVGRTVELGCADIMCHAGFIPEPGSPDRKSFLDVMTKVAGIAAEKRVVLALETGQETAKLLRLTLDELKLPNLKVNFDPANMLLYDMGDPIEAIGILGSDVRSVHLKDAIRPTKRGEWGTEVPLGQGEANIKLFVKRLKEIGFQGPLAIEREVGNQQERLRDIAHGVEYLRRCLE